MSSQIEDGFITGLIVCATLALVAWASFVWGESSVKRPVREGRAIYTGDAEYRCEKIEAQRGEKGGSK